jgi:hypothetical protein
MPSHRFPTLVGKAFFVASALVGWEAGLHAVVLAATTTTTDAAARRPALAPRLPDHVAATFNEALAVALDRLQTHASCQALFARLGADGAAKVTGASYYPASTEQERRYCRPGVFAVTTVGGAAVVLCRRFGHLSGQRAAIILIHEALHLAGLAEDRVDAKAPDSLAITSMVMKGCWLF